MPNARRFAATLAARASAARLGLPGALLLVCLGAAPSAAAQSPVRIAKLHRPPAMDGTLNDPAWRGASVFTDFKTLHPRAGRNPSERTEVHLAYDHANLYVGLRSLDRSADSIRAVATGPESAFDDDWVAFCVDSRDQGVDAFFFLVTPGGVRVNGTLDANGSVTPTTGLTWSSAVKRGSAGYTVEMVIPLAQLAYGGGDRVGMAFKAVRSISRGSEEVDSPAIDPERPHVAQFRRIVLAGIDRSLRSADHPLFDVRAALREKLRLIAMLGDTTLDERVRAYGDASVLDYLIFPERPVHASRAPFVFPRAGGGDSVGRRFAREEYLPGRRVGDVERFLDGTLTTAFIVIRNDTILYEKYFNGWGRDSVFTSFSVAKAFVSTLVGVAVDRGLIHSVADPITAYLPELARRDPRFARITIRDLLRMSSGLRYVEDDPPHDDQRTYMDPDLRRAGLDGSAIVEEPGGHWLYNNYNPLLLGMVLERVSGRSVTDLLQTEIWEPLGMEFGGSWSLDSRADGFEKMESGINARAIDYAKLGSLFLGHGMWNGRRIVSASWIAEASQPWPAPAGYYTDEDFFGRGGHYFGYFIWGDRRDGGESDFHTVGNKGQYVYVSPQKHLIIVRTGIQFGIPSSRWLRLFRELADQF
jgi:CubicO group peptidase (beta-lactamase class C family)